MIIVVDY